MQRLLQQSQHPVSAGDVNKGFKSSKAVTKAARQQQIESLLETFSTLGLLRKTGQGLYTR
ncbi:hypothetical protein [Flavisolibacter nicotianae]|uniref:hypothetical protein n=1 Tax=Flavisolibacter nicotianae TaxID=2364882 RepID=UPI0013C4167D|nr:hypothetical protein [Flavisolibacter nicotianae]